MEDAPTKKSRTNTSSKNKSNVDDKQTDSEKNVIEPPNQLPYDIWTLVFKYLNGRDMYVASTVCRMWRDALEKEKALRGPMYMIKRLDDLSSNKGREIVDDLKIKPSVALCYCENLVANNVFFLREKDCICKNLPTACDIVYMYSYEVYMRKSYIERQLPDDYYKAGCTFFPHLPHAQIKVHYLEQSRKCQTSDMMKHARKMGAELMHKAREKSKCIIMFCNSVYAKYMHFILDSLTYRKDKQQSLALMGGQTDFLLVCKKEEQRMCRVRAAWVAITLSKAGLQSWSVLIKRNCYDKKQIEGKLQELKDKIELKRHTAGFMFGCCARINNKDVEMESFKTVFPDVPLVCCYGDGEFGVDTIHDDPKSLNRKLSHQYSTIFLILTYA